MSSLRSIIEVNTLIPAVRQQKLTFLAALAGSLVDSFFVAAALFVGAFLAAVLALEAGEVPVTDWSRRHE
jgi:hypothetical protein